MKVSDTVKFVMHDSLFKDFIIGADIVKIGSL